MPGEALPRPPHARRGAPENLVPFDYGDRTVRIADVSEGVDEA
jgi:hypothetical protein